ncbi:DUF1654 domain-containing protein [Pseudomonas aeruginosa]|uniref:DUF1654 domain-containing protein n=1 Tax=Pseudomonas aeruginosa TaxID=287 RepID=UPI000E30C3C4|nr:DUF1654 domain-containing protein [Pseudomonas aeruginosa]NPX71438.1 DUF1654 domain-containing protein [Pseudomonas aeruginosa]NQA46767.1 DUF1654 domain-containing protein [Pseudomonas aeruginosa]RIZ07131.1 hypothetical protein AXW96_17290 [Pseudomonas aeruginosa]RRI69815.1 DUF1654 domain-containing protein [Pseudomonas aeruginosa]
MLFSPWSETTYIAVVDRVRALIESPQAQVQQSVRIKRASNEPEWAWLRLERDLRSIDGVNVEARNDGSLFVYWYVDLHR